MIRHDCIVKRWLEDFAVLKGRLTVFGVFTALTAVILLVLIVIGVVLNV